MYSRIRRSALLCTCALGSVLFAAPALAQSNGLLDDQGSSYRELCFDRWGNPRVTPENLEFCAAQPTATIRLSSLNDRNDGNDPDRTPPANGDDDDNGKCENGHYGGDYSKYGGKKYSDYGGKYSNKYAGKKKGPKMSRFDGKKGKRGKKGRGKGKKNGGGPD